MLLTAPRTSAPSGKSAPVPAPLGGLNARDPWRSMPKGDALVLRNWVVRSHGLEQRKGRTLRNTMQGPIIALMRAGDFYFAGTPTAIYDVTNANTAIEVVTGLTGLTRGRWSWAPFANGTGPGIIATNGTDGPRYFVNGAWGASVITGVEATALDIVTVHGRRAMFGENGTFHIWYLAPGAISGAARLLNLGPVVKRGGEWAGLASHSPDGGEGANARFYAVTTKGELVVYAGYDPDNAATWSLVGVYHVPPPVGRDCFCKVGGQLCYLSRNGLLSIPTLLGVPESKEQDAAITAKVGRLYDEMILDAEDDGDPVPYTLDSTAYTFDSTSITFDADADATPGTEETWSVCESASENVLIINRIRSGSLPLAGQGQPVGLLLLLTKPDGGEIHRQLVKDEAWSEWDGIPATCWMDTGRELWFGTATGYLYKYTGGTDLGTAIDSYLVEAYARNSGRVDRPTVILPLFEDPPTYRPRLKMIYDFAEPQASLTATTQAFQKHAAQTVAGRGRDAAFCMAVKSTRGCVYIGRDSVVEPGGNP